jgi:predicted ATPase
MLKRIAIKGFKSIWDADIDLGKINVFIGTNGAGKSNFLEALAVLSSSFEGGVDYERLARRGARLSSPEIFRSSLKNKDRLKSFSIEADFDDLKYRSSISSVEGFNYHSEKLSSVDDRPLAGRSNRGGNIQGVSLETKLVPDKSIVPLYRAFSKSPAGNFCNAFEELEHYAIYSPSTPILRGSSPDNSNRAPLGLYGGRLAEALRELISEKTSSSQLARFFRLLDWFQSIGSDSGVDKDLISDHVSLGRYVVTFRDKFMKNSFDNLYAYDVSEGALYILFVLVLMLHKNSPKIFALDNVDSALNPGLVRDLMGHISELVAKDNSKQLFITTHNPTTLDSIDLFNGDHRLFVVQRKEDGQTEFRRISPPNGMTQEQWNERYMGLKMSEIWLSGAIGGLPIGF